jgi:glycosyltransferase involved in cell wall biosynthesis
MESMPNVYLICDELSPEEMNDLYCHPKIKAHISFTKGEGYGRPLLEASMSGKPLIVPYATGHTDFIKHTAVVKLPTELMNIHPSAVWQDVIIPESKWHYVNYDKTVDILLRFFKEYYLYQKMGTDQKAHVRNTFTLEAMGAKFKEILDKHVPEEAELILPDII